MRLLCALGLFLALLHVTSCLLIGAFNIRQFGPLKSGIKESMTEAEKEKSKEAMKTITEIVLRYDIILIQEVLDKDGKVTKRLMDLVNKDSPHHFGNISSEPLPLGGTNKERYLFLYRDKKVEVVDSFQYDEAGDFRRPPFVVQFSSTQTAVKEFVLIPIHTQPDYAVKELNALVKVVEEAKKKWNNNNIMVLGDFNAGGTYVKAGDWLNIDLSTNKKDFHWLIHDNVDTTVAPSKNAYDRIVVTTEMEKGVVKDSAKVFNFMAVRGLTQDQAKEVSDHFPVEVELKPKVEPPGKASKRPGADDLPEPPLKKNRKPSG